MSLPGNGIFVVRGEMSTLMTAMRRGSRWNSSMYMDEEKDGLMKMFIDLKQILNRIEDLRLIDPNAYLAPFLEVIKTDETTGAVTSLALAAVNKFLSYGLIDPTVPNLAVIVENIVDAVTHARFMGTDQSSDGVTLLRVIEVLHTLMRSPEGSVMTNEAVCDVMLSCFKICFEPRLSELLRRYAEQALKDMVLLLFMRLPQFSEDRSESGLLKKFQMMAATIDQNKKQRNKKNSVGTATANTAQRKLSANLLADDLKSPPLATTPATPAGNILDMQGKISQTPTGVLNTETATITTTTTTTTQTTDNENEQLMAPEIAVKPATPPVQSEPTEQLQLTNSTEDEGSNEFINSLGVRFTQQSSLEAPDGLGAPYGLPCIQELFRFLILICNPMDKQNTDTMMHMGLSLLTVAFEVGADNIGKYDTLLDLVADDLCKNLIALLNSERLSIFAANLRVCFLIFESLRGHLKFQMEAYLKKLAEIIASDNPKTAYEMRELALENLLQLWRIPNFVTEMYINYDCDLYSSDQFENLTKLLSKYTLSATNSVLGTHIIAMDCLVTVIEHIERNCVMAKSVENAKNAEGDNVQTTGKLSKCHSRHNSGADAILLIENETEKQLEQQNVQHISKYLKNSSRWCSKDEDEGEKAAYPSCEQLAQIKHKKRLLTQGTEIFNQRPEKGIQYLQENGILKTPLDAHEVALYLRENSSLDKKMIGEYISKKKNVELNILQNFVDSFDFANLRVDEALRLYLETFRLPGEAPLIFLVLEHFADHWHKQNGEPFANTDAAFSLAYAIIMLNMDQHNSNAKRLNVPMTEEDFMKNLRGLNGGTDFEQDMLSKIFQAIKNDEIVMPAEQTGAVRENYLWKVLLRRGASNDGVFHYVQGSIYDLPIFSITWGGALSALSFMFDKSNEQGYQRSLAGFTRCAAISAHYNLHANFDALILTICKFTTLLQTTPAEGQTTPAHYEIVQAVNFALNPKAQAAMRTVFALLHDYGDSLRDSWKHILELYVQLFRLKLLPKSLMEVEDFCSTNGKVQLFLEKPREKQEAGLFSSLYSYLASDGQREPSAEEQEFIKIGKKCIKDCQLDLIIQETKFLQLSSLQELIKHVLALVKPPTAHKSLGQPYAEDVTVFWMEFLVKIVIYNRDRMLHLWVNVRDHMYLLLMGGTSCGYDYLLNRSIVALLKLAIYLMRNEELCPIVLQSLKMLLMLKQEVLLQISKPISIGIYELLKTSAQNIHSEQDWQIIFTILECVGAGAVPPQISDASLPLLPNAQLERSLEEDTPAEAKPAAKPVTQTPEHNNFPPSPTAEHWILVNKHSDDVAGTATLSRPQTPPQLCSLIYNCKLVEHSPFALFKCWDSLAFIVRNVAHITPYNFECCVRCIRTFVEACRDGGLSQQRKQELLASSKTRKERVQQTRHNNHAHNATVNAGVDAVNASANETLLENDEALTQRYETLSIQLLDLMYTLYTRTAQIFRWWAEEGCAVPQCSALWAQGWCPLLQGIARLAMDRRREVRTYAISCLQQRALLVHDLQALSGAEWAACFQQVLFPLLNELLPESQTVAHLDVVLLEESRIRTATIMSKVFLHHLTPLLELGEAFNELWLDVLNYVEKFMRVGSDMLSEQMQEILKNMLLVMHSVRVFHNTDGSVNVELWQLTWQRIGEFLPQLKDELFRDEDNSPQLKSKLPNEVLPEQTQQLQQEATAMSPILSPVESPRNSIIFKPLEENNLANVVGNMPVIVPQQSTETAPTPAPVTDNDASCSFAIELPETPPHTQLYEVEQQSVYYQPNSTQQADLPPAQSIEDGNLPPVPISHLLAGHQYPSLPKKMPNAAIVHSFAPVYVQSPAPQCGVDIYEEYVQNPYNLTLHVADQIQQQQQQQQQQPQQLYSNNTNLTTASNYFNTNTVDPSSIPPGSEMLFGQP